MSLGDEPVVNQHGPNMSNMAATQRPLNCLPGPLSPPVAPPIKSNPLSAALSGANRNLGKSCGSNRPKMERTLSKQDSIDTEDVMPPSVQRMRVSLHF